MDVREKDKFGMEKGEDHASFEASAAWQFHNQSIGMVGEGNQIGPSNSMVDTFSSGLWSQPGNPPNMGFCETNAQTGASTSSNVPPGKPVAMPSRLDMGGVFLPTSLGVLPPSLPHFPADSAFIARAARYSCFNGGSFGGEASPFGSSESLSPYSSHSKGSPGAQIQKGELNRTDALNDATISVDRCSASPMKDRRDKGGLHSLGDSGEREFSGMGQEGTSSLGNVVGDSSSRGIAVRKRKRAGQDMELEQIDGTQELTSEVTKENVDGKHKSEHNSSTMAIVKSSGKQPTNSSEAPKDDCIHVRARRGQATNSHSLAERVRRERISERMKFLQDLVPGCSKVTGKAVMLDEIINYVQSLQRQVEFLSMKLATVNPRLDFNMDGLLAKDLLHSRPGPSSTMGFPQNMIHPQMHLPHQGFIPQGMSDLTVPSDALRRALSAQLIMANGYKDPTAQIPGGWDDALQNVIQMNFGTANPPHNTQN